MNRPENVPLIRAEFIRRDPDPGKVGKFIVAGFGESMQGAFEDAVMQLSARDGVRMPGENSRKAAHPADEIAARVKADLAEKFEQAFTGPDAGGTCAWDAPANFGGLTRSALVMFLGRMIRIDGLTEDEAGLFATRYDGQSSLTIPSHATVTILPDPDNGVL